MKIVRLCGGLVALAALYAICAGTLSIHEFIAGVIALAMAAAFATLITAVGRPIRLRAPWVRLIGRVLASIVLDSIKVGLQLVRQLKGRPVRPMGVLREQSFDSGSLAPADAGRRALVTLAVSLSPNKYVVAISPDKPWLILHAMVHVKPSANARWPV